VVHALLLAAPIWLLAQTSQPASRMVLKNGTVYLLKEAPRISGGRIVFTTTDGKIFSLSESEVESITDIPRPTPLPRTTYNPEDDRDLGAIARQERHGRGLTSETSPHPGPSRTARPPSRVRPTRTPRPTRSRTPSPAAVTKPHG
jgi:hypothetical protein